jgi:3-hydroxyacyl-[acyl-carrier-protein] dehydratase
MPPQLLFEIADLDLSRDVYDQDVVREYNPQRGDMEMLNGIVHVNEAAHELIGYKNVRADEFWVAGHIPGRPIFPGVLMIEAAAQLAAFYTGKFLGWSGFIGFSGADECRFRQAVLPPAKLLLLGKQIWKRHGRVGCKVQGLVDGGLVFEITIIGVQM